MAIILNKGRVTSTPSVVDRTKYTRPSDWTDLPALSQGDEKVYLLVNVGEDGGNYMRLKFQGDFQVDWGDGSVTTHSSNTNADHEILWDDAPSNSLTSQGYRQVIVTVTAQAGQQLTHWNLPTSPYVPDGSGYNGSINHLVCRVKMAGENFTNTSQAMRFHKGLKEFEYVGTNNITTASYMFNNCPNLEKVTTFDTSNIENLSHTFRTCSSLTEVPAFDLSSATNITYMFENCVSIYKIPKMTLPPTVVSLQYCLRQCYNLQEVPFNNLNYVKNFFAAFSNTSIREFNFSLDSATSLVQMFYQTNTIQTIKFHNIPVGQLTDISYCFGYCYSLTYIKPFDTSGVTNFRNCYSYIDFDIDLSFTDTSSGVNFESILEGNDGITDASWINVTSNATNVIELFFGCRRLEKYPDSLDLTNCTTIQGTFLNNFKMKECPTLLNSENITSGFRTFQNCYNLNTAPSLSGQFTTVREMFNNCYSLSTIPQYDLSLIVAYPNSFRFALNCNGLKKSLITTHQSQVNYANCGLGRDAIVDIFNNLMTNTDGRTIYVGSNPGSPQLTAGDLAIATGKGWTVSA